MIEMYTAEMEEAQMYITQIQDILKKLGAKPTKSEPVESKQGKKSGRKPSVKVVEKAEPKKRGRKPKVVLPTVEAAISAKPVKKEVKKKEKKVAATVESVVSSLITKEPKKEVKKAAKTKSTEKKRIEEMATSAKLVKSKTKKTPKAATASF